MTDIAKHVRIFHATPDDEYVTKRTTAITTIEATIKKKTTASEMYSLANNIIQSVKDPKALATDIKDVTIRALKKASTSFVEDGEQLQISTCAFLAVQRYLEKAKPNNGELTPDILFSLALASGLSFQGTISDMEKLEALQIEIQQTAIQKTRLLTEVSRKRKDVSSLPLTVTKEVNTFTGFATLTEGNYGVKIGQLKHNAILDSEELNILWWALSEWSSIAGKQFRALNGVQASVMSALEISTLLKRYPGDAHVQLACKYSNAKEEFTARELLDQVGAFAHAVTDSIKNSALVNSNPLIFPTLSIFLNHAENSGNNSKRSIFEWTGRIIWESAMLNIDSLS